jgi:hypothetical protein
MFIPEYTITSKFLNNVAIFEYSKAVIENTIILPSWENQLIRETRVAITSAALKKYGLVWDIPEIKKSLDDPFSVNSQEFKDTLNTINLVEKLSTKKDFSELCVQEIAKSLAKTASYRDTKITGKIIPEEILAKIVQYFDWYQSLDAKETHPIIVSAITKAFIEANQPFKKQNSLISDFAFILNLKTLGYSLKNLLSLDEYFEKTERKYLELINGFSKTAPDFTDWLEYISEGMAIESSNIKEKVKLLAKDTKIAKASGRAKFTTRQERIVEYLQDYGVLQNKDFTRIFPDFSEDSILRDLKFLIDKGVVIKSGSTKSSRYELA